MMPTTGSPSERAVRDALVEYAHRVAAKGWVANHDGNLTARLGSNRIVGTPTAFAKAEVGREDLVVVDAAGKKVGGRQRPFSELELHLAYYDVRPDVGAVVHAHPPFATAMACAGVGLDEPFIAEAVVSLGARIPLVPFAAPKSEGSSTGVREHAAIFDALILAGHGVIACGVDVEQAFLRVELVEHLARIATHAQAWGGVRALSGDVVGRLLEARKKAGLGPEARGVAVPEHLVRVASSPPRTPPRAAGIGADELTGVILEELRAILGAR